MNRRAGVLAWRRWVPPVAVIALAIGLWELGMVVFDPERYLLPAPHGIAAAWLENWDLLARNGANTAKAAVVGATIGGTAALVAAAAVSPVRWCAQPASAYASMLQATPLVVLTPLFNIWFGAGFTSKVSVVAIATFPVMFIATVRGLQMTDPRLERLFRSYAAGPFQTFVKVRLPNALPSVLSGVKVAASAAMIVAIVAELFGGPVDSIGTYMRQEAFFFRTRNTWAAAFTAVIFGLALYSAAGLAERLLLRWHPSRRTVQ